MLSARWINKHRPYWTRLYELLGRTGNRGASALTHQQLQELGLLYRQSASDLSVAREDASSQQLTAYLNQLLGRAHNLIYMGRRREPLGIWKFYSRTYPQIFRETLPYTLVAFLAFLTTMVFGVVLCLHDPAFPRYLLGGKMMDTIDRREMWTHSVVSMKPAAASAIMTNNLTVGFAAFALGITGGLGTIYIMAFNGLLFGVISTACWQAAMAGQLFSFVAPHGVLELPAIFIAGGAGLLIARGELFPGYLSRKDSLARSGGTAVKLLLGTIPLLIIAGTVEGFVSPTDISPKVKYLLAAALFTLMCLYLGTAGRNDTAPAKEHSPH